MTPFPDDEAIGAAAEGFLDLTLPKPQWTHAAHFAVALWLLRHRPDLDPPRAMPAMIRAYNAATGVANTDTEGYHETITRVSLAAARAWLAARPDEPLHTVLADLLAGPLGRSDWPLAYWSRERLFSTAARRDWVDPDLAPIPWPLP
jgi:hypothetical protein